MPAETSIPAPDQTPRTIAPHATLPAADTYRIAMLSNLYPPVVSGSSLQLRELSRMLVRNGHEVVVITAKLDAGLPDYEQVDGLHVYRLPALRLPRLRIALNFQWLNATYWPANIRRVRCIVERHRCQVLHVHNHIFDMAFHGARLHRTAGLPTVLSLHTPVQHTNPFYHRLLALAERMILKRGVVRQMQSIICPDYNIVRYIRARFGREDFELIPYGVAAPPPAEAAVVQRCRREFGLDGRKLILSVGHLHAIRNRMDLIRAMPAIRRAVPEALLLIVGGIFDTRPVKLAESLGLGGHVVFTGLQPNEVVQALLAQACAEAHWFTFDERRSDHSPGIATMEAMLAGVPVLTAAPEDTYGPSVLRHGHNVMIVEPGDVDGIAATLIRLLTDPDLRQSIGQAGQEVARTHFTWEQVVARTAAAYRRVLTGQPAGLKPGP
jgi:1,2-diacylglycerol 3-alpha-glucosyltransferase